MTQRGQPGYKPGTPSDTWITHCTVEMGLNVGEQLKGKKRDGVHTVLEILSTATSGGSQTSGWEGGS